MLSLLMSNKFHFKWLILTAHIESWTSVGCLYYSDPYFTTCFISVAGHNTKLTFLILWELNSVQYVSWLMILQVLQNKQWHISYIG